MSIWRAAMLLPVIALATSHCSTISAAETSPRLLRHIVMYKYKDGLSAAQVAEAIEAFAALKQKIDLIVSLEHGQNVSPEGKSDGLTYAFVVTFNNEADRDAYLKHPAHLEYVKLASTRRDKVVVFDYWTGE
ncbi:MAG: Dabb family protein [Pirellulales bacterium]